MEEKTVYIVGRYYAGMITRRTYSDLQAAKMDVLGGLLEMLEENEILSSIEFSRRIGREINAPGNFDFVARWPVYYDGHDKTRLISKCDLSVVQQMEDGPHWLNSYAEPFYTEVLAAFGANIAPVVSISYDVEGRLFQ